MEWLDLVGLKSELHTRGWALLCKGLHKWYRHTYMTWLPQVRWSHSQVVNYIATIKTQWLGRTKSDWVAPLVQVLKPCSVLHIAGLTDFLKQAWVVLERCLSIWQPSRDCSNIKILIRIQLAKKENIKKSCHSGKRRKRKDRNSYTGTMEVGTKTVTAHCLVPT